MKVRDRSSFKVGRRVGWGHVLITVAWKPVLALRASATVRDCGDKVKGCRHLVSTNPVLDSRP